MDNSTQLQKTQKVQLTSFMTSFMAQVYGFMSLGVLATSIVAFIIYMIVQYVPSSWTIFLALMPFVFILELVIVIGLSIFATKVNGFVAGALFLFYSLINGVFFGVVILRYDLISVLVALGATMATFIVLAVYGYVTKSDLSRWGAFAMMGLFGLIIGTIVNIIVALINPGLGNGMYWILTYVGIGIFSILVAYDSQKIKQIGMHAESTQGDVMAYAIQGALILYLDFINLFIRILAIMGKKK